MRMKRVTAAIAAGCFVSTLGAGLPSAAAAQEEESAEEGEKSLSEMSLSELREWMPDPATLSMPELAFEPSSNDIDNYKKYYYFSRVDTEFSEAFDDLRYCDALSRGLSVSSYGVDPGYAAAYGIGGVIGGVIGGALANAIYGSAEARAKRRVNMRRCMHFKGYARHGLAKDLWQEFNFEEGNSDIPKIDRQQMLARQALVASSGANGAEDIGL